MGLRLGPAWGSSICDMYFQTGKSPENGHLAGGWSRLNPRSGGTCLLSLEKRRVWGNLIEAFCYRKRSLHEGGAKLFSEVLSKRQQSQRVAARQDLIGHNRIKM